MPRRTAHGNDDRIQQVPRKRNPGGIHGHKQIYKVIQGRIADKQPGRILEQLVQRLQGIVDDHHQGQRHQNAEDAHQEEQQAVACHRAIELVRFQKTRFSHSPTLLSTFWTTLLVPTISRNRMVAMAEA